MAGMGAWPERKVRWAVLAGAVAVVTGGKTAPNGVACGPVCYQANVTVHPNGTLTVNPG
jgi:hypothetical protein